MVLYLSYYYTSSELPIRLSFFWVSLSTTTILGSLLAAGILQLRGSLGWAGWRCEWSFLPDHVLGENFLPPFFSRNEEKLTFLTFSIRFIPH